MGKVIHAVVDNYATHEHRGCADRLARHPRSTFHFARPRRPGLTPFKASSPSSAPASRAQSVVDLRLAINRFVAETNADPKPFVWTADPKRVLAAVKRGKQVLE